jgi:6-phosphogluconolactonase
MIHRDVIMLQVFEDPEALSKGAAALFAELAQRAVQDRGRFGVSLAGGNTPKRVYELLAQEPHRTQVPWDRVHVFWGDERCVPSDDPRSNARMAGLALLDHVPIPAAQIHPVNGAIDPAKAARQYEAELGAFFAGQPPRFDLILLGLGENGHTASLFPSTPVLHEKDRWVKEVYVAEQSMYRVTMTAPLINQAALIAFVLAGAGKAEVLRQVREGPRQPEDLPAQLIVPDGGELRWLVDRAAAP